jgi:hypothetical protein
MEPQDEAESPLCECDLDLTMQEIDSGKCSACGKKVLS